MGQCNSSRKAACNQQAYFSNKKKKVNHHFNRSQTFLENSSEWVVIFKEKFSKYSNLPWSQPIFNLLNSWQSFHDSSSRVAFVWDEINSFKLIPKIDQSRACKWPTSIANLQTFSYEVESDPYKKKLNSLILQTNDCTIYKLIKIFKSCLFNFYCERIDEKLQLKEMFSENIQEKNEEIDEIILEFINIIVKILPMFFIDFPANIQDVQEIVRNAVVSGILLDMLVMIRKTSFNESQKSYLQGLKEFDNEHFSSPIAHRLSKNENENFQNAVKSLLDITSCQSIGQVHDSIAMLMNYISMGLYDESDENNLLEEEEIIQAFLVIVGKSHVAELPVYLDILNKFLDNNTLNVKSVGQGIVKLTYIIDKSSDWRSFLNVI